MRIGIGSKPGARSGDAGATAGGAASTMASGVDVVEAALADAIESAAAAGEWAIVAQLARELESRRLALAARTASDGTR